MKELEKKHTQERYFFIDLMKDPDINDLCDEARSMSEEDRNTRMVKLRDKRDELDFEDSCKLSVFDFVFLISCFIMDSKI